MTQTPIAHADQYKDGWFTELSALWPGQGLSIQYDEILFQERSKLQDVAVLSTKAFGTTLVLDGVIQCTERDEFAYQEMIAHLPLCALETPPTRVLVVGGGDGGVLRELCRYPSIKELHIAEIDAMVPEVSKRFFPKMAVGFSDPRVTLNICDGIKFVSDAEEGYYDAIVVDSSDPVGPAEVLFEEPFFRALHRAVRPGGIVCTQAESVWLHLDIIKALAGMCARVFEGGSVSYAYTTIPTYPSGQIGMMLCAKARPVQGASADADGPLDPRVPRQAPADAVAGLDAGPLRYYDAALHRAAFALPRFAAEALAESLTFAPGA
uniref:spermidine synthase n=1 Tax=Chlamydomonas euryale TaxID=1486919 RepID=A0A7R9VY35_9CHLO